MIVFKREFYDDVVEDIKPLILEHWNEIALHKDKILLNPDFRRYKLIENSGKLTIITARKETELVGYSIFFLGEHIHYKHCFVATNDVLFLTKKERKGSCGIRLIKESERILKELGAKRLLFHVKPNKDFSPILARCGYVVEEIIMGKLLGD